MRTLILLSLVTFSFCSQLESQWEQFKLDFDRHFATAEEEESRKSNFLRSVEIIESHNKKFAKGLVSHELGVNQFADWSVEEYESLSRSTPAFNLSTVPNLVVVEPDPTLFAALPASFDWRQQNKVTGVKNQGQCGSCWAFAAVATIESALAIHRNQAVSLSEQQLVDCDRSNQACTVGNVGNAMEYVQQNGLESEAQYPYVARVENCMNNAVRSHVKISGHQMLRHPPTDEEIMSAIMSHGPVAVNIDASGDDFQHYKNGILTTGNKQMNHYVTAVGWGPGYWIVKNSWGTTWGQSGFGQLGRGSNVRGFNNWVFYPTV